MKLDEILSMIQEDSVIDVTALDAESLKIPYLHSKWYKIFIEELKALKGLEAEYDKMMKEKFEYYLGKAEDEVYEKKPLNHKILKQDVDFYLKSDEDLISIRNKKSIQEMKVKTIEEFIKSLNQRSFSIKNAIEFMKFKNGVI